MIAFRPRIHGLARGPDLEGLVERSLQRAALWEEVKDKLRALPSPFPGDNSSASASLASWR